jgi:hypothetical protein
MLDDLLTLLETEPETATHINAGTTTYDDELRNSSSRALQRRRSNGKGGCPVKV